MTRLGLHLILEAVADDLKSDNNNGVDGQHLVKGEGLEQFHGVARVRYHGVIVGVDVVARVTSDPPAVCRPRCARVQNHPVARQAQLL